MRTLFKLAVGAAIAGALVTLALRQTKSRRTGRGRSEVPQPYADDPPRGAEGFTLAELAVKSTGGSEGRADGDEPMRTGGQSPAKEKALNS